MDEEALRELQDKFLEGDPEKLSVEEFDLLAIDWEIKLEE